MLSRLTPRSRASLRTDGDVGAGAAAANIGWHVTYLGASLPAAEIAGAAMQNRARAVALSLVYPQDDPRLEGELIRLRDMKVALGYFHEEAVELSFWQRESAL